ncbi:DUF2490 domain-containing protein [Spongiivirga citrea]|uniref:DUF2490 domain-containing protein n=1 Tax=Spongiivirga citrea TaxID=1481457 RepID=A0A6M0CTA0_9FLAO|nr:DUF2490 domain-containing protein [Spongiivirga citrea]NER18747.1 DUF2490 domain-containing protein [Spongiivirga citrea]
MSSFIISRKYVTVLLLLFICSFLKGQNNQFGSLSAINLRKGLAKDWKLNFNVTGRQQFARNKLNIEEGYEYLLTDLSVIAAKKTGLNNSLASGYLVRFEKGSTSHRFIEQFTIVSHYNSFRLSHRFRADLTLNKNYAPETRIRYRIAPEIPLSGLAVDEKEFYLKLNNEYLVSFQSDEQDLEIRLVPALGYRITKNNRLEIGLDSRIDSFLNNESRKRFWLVLNWYGIL